MKLTRHAATILIVAIGLLVAATPAQAEIVEEIIAWVNGEIITVSENDEEEQARIAEAYRTLSGTELDEHIAELREQLLINLIDRRILLHQAQAMGYDLEQMGDSFLDTFAKQQGYDGVEEIQAMAERDGMAPGFHGSSMVGYLVRSSE